MLTLKDRDEFLKNGYLLLPEVLNSDQITQVRDFLDRLFAHGPKYHGESQVRRPFLFDHYPEIRWLLYHHKLVDALKVLLGNDYGVFMAETVALDSYHFSYWHKDTSAIESLGYDFQWQKDFLVVNTLLYLQDNIEDYGGGLDVIPGSHLSEDPGLKKTGGYIMGEEKESYYTIPSKAGDVVIIDIRLTHRATPSKKQSKWSRRTISCWCGTNSHHVNNLKDTSLKQQAVMKLINEYYARITRVHPSDKASKDKLYEELIKNIRNVNS